MAREKYRLYTYDVWGNKREGWDVNQVFSTSEYYDVDPDWDNKKLVAELKKQGLIKKRVRLSSIGIDGDEEVIYFDHKERPEFELRRQR